MILLDTHAWVRWLHSEISGKLPLELTEWFDAALPEPDSECLMLTPANQTRGMTS